MLTRGSDWQMQNDVNLGVSDLQREKRDFFVVKKLGFVCQLCVCL